MTSNIGNNAEASEYIETEPTHFVALHENHDEHDKSLQTLDRVFVRDSAIFDHGLDNTNAIQNSSSRD